MPKQVQFGKLIRIFILIELRKQRLQARAGEPQDDAEQDQGRNSGQNRFQKKFDKVQERHVETADRGGRRSIVDARIDVGRAIDLRPRPGIIVRTRRKTGSRRTLLRRAFARFSGSCFLFAAECFRQVVGFVRERTDSRDRPSRSGLALPSRCPSSKHHFAVCRIIRTSALRCFYLDVRDIAILRRQFGGSAASARLRRPYPDDPRLSETRNHVPGYHDAAGRCRRG